MRTLHTALFAGIAAIGLSGMAVAQTAQTHVMTIRMPGGGIAQIQYTGNLAPQVSIASGPAAVDAAMPMPTLFGPDSPFAALDRISAEMDRQLAEVLHAADAAAAQARSGRMVEAGLNALPPGIQSYSFVSTMSGNGVCSESVEIIAPGNGQKPRIVRHSSGNCAALPRAGGAVSLPAAPAPKDRPDVVRTSAHGAHPSAGLVREIPAAVR